MGSLEFPPGALRVHGTKFKDKMKSRVNHSTRNNIIEASHIGSSHMISQVHA